MGASQCVTYEDVVQACTKLGLNTSDITTRRIRTEIGYGSLSTISRHLKEWREKTRVANPPQEVQSHLEGLRTPPKLYAVRPSEEVVAPSTERTDIAPTKLYTPVQQPKWTLRQVAASTVIAVFIFFLTRFLILESAAFYKLAGQARPLEMAVLSELGLLLCAFAGPRDKILRFFTKAMMLVILIFMAWVMTAGVNEKNESHGKTHNYLEGELADLESYNSSLGKSIETLEARSRLTEASHLRETMRVNHVRMQQLNTRLMEASPVNAQSELVLVLFRIGALLLNVLFAHILLNIWSPTIQVSRAHSNIDLTKKEYL